MQQCASHVPYQLPNEHTRVGYLLEAIQCPDPGLQAAIAQIKTDDSANGKRNSFEATAAYLLPYDPVAKKRAQGTKRGQADISAVDTAEVSGLGTPRSGLGKTGVHLRYHTKSEYTKLTSAQKTELREWRSKSKDKSSDGKPKKQAEAKALAAAVDKAIDKRLAATETPPAPELNDESTKSELKAYIMSLFPANEPPAKKVKIGAAVSEPSEAARSTLHSILRRVKKRGD